MSEKYKEGLNRNQQLLFPPSLDEYVDKDNSVRAIDDYVSLLDLKRYRLKDGNIKNYLIDIIQK